MCHTGNYGNTKYWKLEGAINNHTSYSFYNLLRQIARLCNYYRVSDSGCLGDFFFKDWHWCYCISSVSQWQYSQHSKYYSKIKCKTFFVVEMPSYKLPLFKTLHSMLLKKQKHLFWCRKNNFSYINRAMVYGPGENSITQKLYSFQKRKMQEYHKRN
jgi:hypothetical protein